MRKPFLGSKIYCEEGMFIRGGFFLFFITLSFFVGISGSLAATCGLGNNNTYDNADQITEVQKCNPGTVKNFTETSTGWSWSCEDGNYPTLVNCSATRVADIQPVCGTEQCTCSVGSVNGCGDTACVNSRWNGPTGEYGKTWDCIGPNAYRGKTVSCFKKIVPEPYPCSGGGPVNGACGTRNTTYPQSTTAWPYESTYCSQGAASASPAFPAPGAQVTWSCKGGGGGSDAPCKAIHSSGNGGTGADIRVDKSGNGAGTVKSLPGGMFDCGSDCSENIALQAYLRIKAYPDSGSTFSGWSGSCAGQSDDCTFRVTKAETITATFNSSGGGGGTCSDKYVRTDDTSQVKIGALGIRGMFIAYGGMKVNSRRVQNVANPTDGTDAATKSYVDSEIAKAQGGGGSGGGVAGGCAMEISRVVSFYTTVSDVWGNGCNPSSTTGIISNDTCQKQSASGYICGELYSRSSTSQNTDMTNKGCLCVKEKSASEVVSGEVSGGCSLILYDSGSYNMALKNSWGIGCIPEYYTGGREKAECRQNAISGYECGRVSHQVSGTETTFGCLCKKK